MAVARSSTRARTWRGVGTGLWSRSTRSQKTCAVSGSQGSWRKELRSGISRPLPKPISSPKPVRSGRFCQMSTATSGSAQAWPWSTVWPRKRSAVSILARGTPFMSTVTMRTCLIPADSIFWVTWQRRSCLSVFGRCVVDAISDRCEASIDHKHGGGDERRVVGSQEQRHPGDVFRLSPTSEWNVVPRPLLAFRGHLADHRRLDRAREKAIAADLRRVLDGEISRHRHHTALG